MSYDTIHGGGVLVTRMAQTSLANICTTDHLTIVVYVSSKLNDWIIPKSYYFELKNMDHY